MKAFSVWWSMQESVSVAPAVGLGFPAQDYQKLDKQLILYAFNLTHSDSPLPHYLLELAVQTPAFSHFLAVFNQVFYEAYFRLWQTCHPVISQSQYHAWRHAYHQAHFSMNTLQALQQQLRILLKRVPFEIQEYHPMWHAITNPKTIGQVNSLNNIALGQRFFSRQFSIAIRIGPCKKHAVNITQLQELLSAHLRHITVSLIIYFRSTSACLSQFYLGHTLQHNTFRALRQY